MVPDDEDGSGVQLAKKICADCPVTTRCLLTAERITAVHGVEQMQGVWGGLTVQERATMAALGELPRPCTRCGLDCVPINLETTECSACRPNATIVYQDYRSVIEQLIEEGLSLRQISDRLRLKTNALGRICRRWKLRPKTRSPGKQRYERLKPCGTLAAKYRHHRAERDSWKSCPACSRVPWNRGKGK